ncbi:MAG TPA: hypothetical protein VFE93_12770 [Myxococcaceae bacterium]|nr:hypothetical protein [Myxococcaceae bacterium]
MPIDPGAYTGPATRETAHAARLPSGSAVAERRLSAAEVSRLLQDLQLPLKL